MSGIKVKNVSKRFGATVALNNVSVSFGENRIYGLLGRNGAGKTTLLNVITNKLFPTEGEILLDGEPVRENDRAQSKIYCMAEKNLYPESMRVDEAFKWTKEFYPAADMEYAGALCEKFALNTKKKVKELSTGYASVFKIAVALCCNAPLLFLDEPVLGLDAAMRDLFYRELIANYSARPKTVVISTHLIEEAADVIEEVAVIKNGEIILTQTAESLLAQGYTVTGAAGAVDEYVKDKSVLGCDVIGGIKSAYVLGAGDKDSAPSGVEMTRMKLQKLFIHLTNTGKE